MKNLLAQLESFKEIVPFESLIDFSFEKESTLQGMRLYDLLDALSLKGMGGAGFPTRLKMESFKNSKNNILVINGVECEPGIMVDKALLFYEKEWIQKGVQFVAQELNINCIYLAIKKKYQNTFSPLYQDYTLLPMNDHYPSGAERLIFEKIIHRYPTVKHRPTTSSVLIHNVGTLWQIGRALSYGPNPLIRPLSLIIPTMNIYKNLMIPLPFSIQDLLNYFHFNIDFKTHSILAGGVMMGKLKDPGDSLDLTTNSLFILPHEILQEPEERDCISCGACYTACPLNLHPSFMHRSLQNKTLSFEGRMMFEECFHCGACSLVCPSSIPLSERFLSAKKSTLFSQGRKK